MTNAALGAGHETCCIAFKGQPYRCMMHTYSSSPGRCISSSCSSFPSVVSCKAAAARRDVEPRNAVAKRSVWHHSVASLRRAAELQSRKVRLLQLSLLFLLLASVCVIDNLVSGQISPLITSLVSPIDTRAISCRQELIRSVKI